MNFSSDDFAGFASIAIAAALGGMIGLEREISQKPAGMRTHMFVCAGSALMMLMGQEIIDQFQQTEQTETLKSDPIRVLQAIVVGISFLGAGTIIHDRREGVEGLTTAATIFVTAGIGVTVAVDRVPLATLLAFCIVAVLLTVGMIERSIRRWWRHRKQTADSGAADEAR